MDISGFIARRYLFAKKSHNVINIISMISAAGIAIGCGALIIILSIYNGFDNIVRSLCNTYTPDLIVTPAQGKTFGADSAFYAQFDKSGISAVSGVLEENVYLKYEEQQCVAVAKGVDSIYQEVTELNQHMVQGRFELRYGSLDEAVIGRTLALELGLQATFLTPLEIYFPSRTEEISLLDPTASLNYMKVFPSGVVSLEQEFDKKYVFVPLSALQTLAEKEGEVSAVEVFVDSTLLDRHGIIKQSFQDEMSTTLGPDFLLKNRRQQNDTVYKLLAYEKIAIYAILLFVMMIISCNIFGSLSMLIIEKQGDVRILQAMGAPEALTKKIFVKEGWLISLFGIVIGVAVGLAVCFLQQKFGIVKMPGNFIIDAYPVEVRLSDVAITVAAVGLIGYLTARLVRK